MNDLISIKPDVCGGKPCIAGHRIRVQDIVVWTELMGMSPDAIVFHCPSIDLDQVHAALAYYELHKEEICQDMEKSESFVWELASQTPSILKQKIIDATSSLGDHPAKTDEC
jgi:uncharacterized protein (DUF433 family)